jgi:hypothetical protein
VTIIDPADPARGRDAVATGGRLTSPALLRRILALAAPTSLVALLQIIAQLAETWIAARQGTAALAGWAVVLPFALMLQQMSTGAMGGGVSRPERLRLRRGQQIGDQRRAGYRRAHHVSCDHPARDEAI